MVTVLSGRPSPTGQQPRPSEGFLVLALLKAQVRMDRAEADIEAVNVDLDGTDLIIQDAERRMAIALETHNSQAKLVPQEDLRNARAARNRLKKIRSGLEEARARAKDTFAFARGTLLSGQRPGPDPRIPGMVSWYAGNPVILKKDGRRIALKRGRPAFLESGDEVLTGGADRAEVWVLDGRSTVQLGVRSRLSLEEDNPQEQIWRILQGKAFSALDSPEGLEGTLETPLKKPGDDLDAILKRYRGLDRAEIMRLFGRGLTMRIPAAVCTIRGDRFGVEVKNEGVTEIAVFEGTVEVSGLQGDKRVLIGEGSIAVVTKDGVSEPKSIGDIDKWWEK
jgi:hypothetical protein